MWVFRDPNESTWQEDLLSFAVGAVGGIVLGVLLSRKAPQPRRLGSELRERARDATRRLRPLRLRRFPAEQKELERLEDAVLVAFVGDAILSERGVDIGAISPGIVEISGEVWSEEESQHAVDLASSVPGVRTVLNRLDVESPTRRPSVRRPLGEDDLRSTFGHQSARVGGMGRRRQSPATDPDRPDDSQKIAEVARAEADVDQFADEGYTSRRPRMAARDEVSRSADTRYREDELDNQDPHGRNADVTRAD